MWRNKGVWGLIAEKLKTAFASQAPNQLVLTHSRLTGLELVGRACVYHPELRYDLPRSPWSLGRPVHTRPSPVRRPLGASLLLPVCAPRIQRPGLRSLHHRTRSTLSRYSLPRRRSHMSRRAFAHRFTAAVSTHRQSRRKSPIRGRGTPPRHHWTTARWTRNCATCSTPILPGADTLWHPKSGQVWCLKCGTLKSPPLPIAAHSTRGIIPPPGWIPGQPLPPSLYVDAKARRTGTAALFAASQIPRSPHPDAPSPDCSHTHREMQRQPGNLPDSALYSGPGGEEHNVRPTVISSR